MSLEGDLAIGEQEDLPVVNGLRSRVKAWRTGSLTGIPFKPVSYPTMGARSPRLRFILDTIGKIPAGGSCLI
jgi:hypothetical protein